LKTDAARECVSPALHNVAPGIYCLIAVQGTKTKKSKTRLLGRGEGLLIGLAPEAFETWVGEQFRRSGYKVQATPFRGDHGVDLILTRDREKTVVQCKHHPLTTIGEPVLRDLFGAMNHLQADGGFLVTTGQVSKAAREWLVGKRIEVWDANRLKHDWSVELAQLAERLAAHVSPDGVPPTQTSRTGWYVYVDDQNNRWAVELPRTIGGQPSLGFEPLTDPKIPPLPRTSRMRHMRLKSVEAKPRYLKRIPYGQPTLPSNAWTEGLTLTSSTGRQAFWRITGEAIETRDRGPQPKTGFVTMRWVPNVPSWTGVEDASGELPRDAP
jgi:Restriction endonuclease